ncbi:pyrimidine reductase family protein [Streptomyces sp. SCUT-3]|uniref:pyrimidine reductase family protein n=1 Tax=Streptomyces sp. SCUT-3 TaxID=2684469 RepID=UPI0015F8A84C|nr:pyrimidine reductase family protein [Streptomyces sp. SCUT-3]QMV21367.1 pyrimidine reductase family protein [Streptomyces sp. SCUT-3]
MRRLYPVHPAPDLPASPSAGPTGREADAAGPLVPGTPGTPGVPEDLDTLEGLAEAYAYPPGTDASAPWLRGNMVSGLDGAAHHAGHSRPLSCEADVRILGMLRALADVVVVGAGTIRAEGYGPLRARKAFAGRRAALGQTPAPAIAVVTSGCDLDFSSPLFTEALTPTVLLTGAAAPEARVRAAREAGAVVITAGEGTGVDPARAVRELARHGWGRLLTEGGPQLLGQFAGAGVLDELCLTIAPMVTSGDASRIMSGPGLDEPRRFSPASILEEDGFLFTRYVRNR